MLENIICYSCRFCETLNVLVMKILKQCLTMHILACTIQNLSIKSIMTYIYDFICEKILPALTS